MTEVIHIVCKSGPEWREILSAHKTVKGAAKAKELYEAELLRSKCALDRLSSILVQLVELHK